MNRYFIDFTTRNAYGRPPVKWAETADADHITGTEQPPIYIRYEDDSGSNPPAAPVAAPAWEARV